MNRTARRKGKPAGMSYADVLARKQMVRQAVDRMAKEEIVRIETERATQKALWLMVVSIADAYGIGKDRMKHFFEVYQANTDELNRMIKENDEDYAYEKLRRKAEEIAGVEIRYLYEQEALEAERRAEDDR